MQSLNPLTYSRHKIHGDSRTWTETNCYVDVVVELLHGLGYEPIAALPFTLGIDFEGDQWTFFKFPQEDLLELYGIEIQEFNPWRSLVGHVDKQLSLGRPVLVEMDSFFLPDTAGTAYKNVHEKSTIAINAIDIERRTMGYFHGQSYYQLEGEDFAELFQLNGPVHNRILPPYIEYMKRRNLQRPLQADDLVAVSEKILRQHLAKIPQTNPFTAFREIFADDFEWLLSQDLATFHQYSFATLRQYGACFELVETYLQWLQQQGRMNLDGAITAFSTISTTAKTFQFQLARAMARKRALDFAPIDVMAESWHEGMTLLNEAYN